MNCDEKCEDCDCDEGGEEEFDCGDMSKEQKALYQEYKAGREKALETINEKLDIATSALEEATNIANETGVSFYSGISPVSQAYGADCKKFADIQSFINEHEDVYLEYDSNGWQHSAVC